MSTEIVIDQESRKRLLDLLICIGSLPGHSSRPHEVTQHYEQVLGKAGAMEYFSLIEWELQSKRQETKK